ncbi:hypothetical protein Clacol_006708 [Clathrus columnatus]|uniref:Large ribosomal subunit protein uL30m n=1 Tax=Clathrus columnatus TaxID=1419009 RepID=A0AAV5ACU4_9AGAM|nr:hypothetical protein Clacol_006708 [Clathrus columnatus]
MFSKLFKSQSALRRFYSTATQNLTEKQEPKTYYKITLLRSAIALPKRYKDTLVTLGIHRRMQTVFHPHKPDIAGKILRVKELVQVENVPASAVRTKTEQRWERRPDPGFEVVGTWKNKRWLLDEEGI